MPAESPRRSATTEMTQPTSIANARPSPDSLWAHAVQSKLPGSPWLLLPLLLLVAVVYWPGLHGGFVFDDFPNIVDNLPLHVTVRSDWPHWLAAIFSSPSSELQRPLAMLSFAVNYALTGLNPYWMKLTNLGIHLLNTWLVFGVVRCVLRAAEMRETVSDGTHRARQALWITAVWALNPINMLAVLFVVQRMESLSHTFVFAGLWLYLLGRARLHAEGRGWLILLTGLIGGTVLGTLVKESAVLLPLYALVLEWALHGFTGRGSRRDRGLLAMFALLLVLPRLIALSWQLPKVLQPGAYAGRSFSLGQRLLTEGRVLVDYLHWTVLPDLSRLSLYHDDYPVSHALLSPPSTLFALLILATLVVAMLGLRKHRPLMALGLAWFFAAQLLTATVIPLELVFEHRNYFASLGLCLVLADGLLRMPRDPDQQRMGIIAALALLGLYAGLTALRVREWQDPLRFSLNEVARHPQSPRATYDVARNFVILSGYRPDSPYVQPAFAALERAMRVPEATTLPDAAAIIFAARIGAPLRFAWWKDLQDKLRGHPIGPQQTASLGSLVECELQHRCWLPRQHMVDTFLAALERGPNAEVLNIYGDYALNLLHDPTLALRLWEEAAQRAPDVVQYQVTLAKMLIANGQVGAAAIHIKQIRRLGRVGQTEELARELEQLAARRSRERRVVSGPGHWNGGGHESDRRFNCADEAHSRKTMSLSTCSHCAANARLDNH